MGEVTPKSNVIEGKSWMLTPLPHSTSSPTAKIKPVPPPSFSSNPFALSTFPLSQSFSFPKSIFFLELPLLFLLKNILL